MTAKEQWQAQLATILADITKRGIRFVNLQFCDILGVVKSVTIPAHQFPEAASHGKWFDGSSIEGFTRIAESDMYLMPDLRTFAVLPWEKDMARVICWVHMPNGERFAGDPRHVLDVVLHEAAALGFTFNTGPELEFFLYRREGGRISPLLHDDGGYFDLSMDLGTRVRNHMCEALEALGIKVETSHHEVAAGQHEIDFQYADALTTADNALTFRYTLKAIAQQHDLHATFMPKPVHGINGSGMHTHMSLFTGEGQNVFHDPADRYGLSETARFFIGGLLQHARGMSAVMAPLVNSYKRLVPGYEAPCYVSWGQTNRSALVRIPRVNPEIPKATRIELRLPDPSANPYLAFAVMLKAGLDGVKNRIAPPEPLEENLYHFDEAQLARHKVPSLPKSLGEALDEMQRDPLVVAALGQHIFERFLDAKRTEWDDYRLAVSQWELDRYLPFY
jgi:glutamine synthetase